MTGVQTCALPISRHAPPDEKLAQEWRHTLALTRKRGFQVILRAPDSQQTARLMAELALGNRLPDYKDEVTRLVNSFDHQLSQPETIAVDALYEIFLISAPLFDQDGCAAFNLSLGGFSKSLSGEMVVNYADRLVRTCLEIMRADRAQPTAARRRGGRAIRSAVP